jgi:hypothetical protein
VQGVPTEALAYLLHHRVDRGIAPRQALPAATAYYSEMPAGERLGRLFDFQSHLSAPTVAVLKAPTPGDLAAMEEALRGVFEVWGTIGETVFGHCGAGLCVRPRHRALCLGCGFLVPHCKNMPRVLTYRKMYAQLAEVLEADGWQIDAQEARQQLQQLDDLRAVMRIQWAVFKDRGQRPPAENVLPPGEEEREANA